MSTPAPPQVSSSPPRGEHTNNIDALRLVLACLVVFSHSYSLAYGKPGEVEPLAWLSGGRIDFGEAAVDGFFILSGYLIAQSWERCRSTWSFARKRAARIYPGYLVAAVVSAIVAVLVGIPGGTWGQAGQTLLANAGRILALRQPIVPGSWLNSPRPHTANGSIWTISYECFCYAGVAGLGLAGLLRRRTSLLGLYLATLVLGYLFLLGEYPLGGGVLGRIFGAPSNWARLLPCYLAGVVLCSYRDRVRWSWPWACLALAGLVAVASLPHGVALAAPTFGAYLTLYCAFAGPIRWHGAARYGDFSYGIYLYAWPIQQTYVWFDPAVGSLRLFAWVAAPCLLAGVASWYGVERWFVRSRPSLPSFRSPRASASPPAGGADPTSAGRRDTPDPG